MKRKKTIILLTIIFLILDIFNFLKVYENISYINLKSGFWLNHLGIALIFILIINLLLKEDMGFNDVVILFLPILGFGVALIDFIIEKYDLNLLNHIEEAYNMENYKREIGQEKMNFQKEINTLGAFDTLLVKSSDEKKKFLSEFPIENLKFKIEVLQKALSDEDTEVVHYSAIELNKIEEKIQKEIKESKEEGNLIELFDNYKKYIFSGLLKEDILEFYQNETLKVLDKLVQTDENFEKEYLDIFKAMKKEDEYEKLLFKLLEKKEDEEIIEKILEFFYEQNRYEEMLKFYEKYKRYEIDLPIIFDNIIDKKRDKSVGGEK